MAIIRSRRNNQDSKPVIDDEVEHHIIIIDIDLPVDLSEEEIEDIRKVFEDMRRQLTGED